MKIGIIGACVGATVLSECILTLDTMFQEFEVVAHVPGQEDPYDVRIEGSHIPYHNYNIGLLNELVASINTRQDPQEYYSQESLDPQSTCPIEGYYELLEPHCRSPSWCSIYILTY